MNEPNPQVLNVIDAFAGVGGITLGLRLVDDASFAFKVRLMVDSDQEARSVATRNFPDIPYLAADVHKIGGGDIRRAARLRHDEDVHLLVGGPPCQGFSWLGKRALDDHRNVHLLDFLRLVKELKPFAALMENVPLVITSHKGAILQEVVEGFEELGYICSAEVLRASDYGVPQLRKRAFILGYRKDLGIRPRFPSPTHERVPMATALSGGGHKPRFEDSKLPYVSVEEAIGDLPSLEAGGGAEVLFYAKPSESDYQRWARKNSVAIFNHRSRAHSKEYLAKISIISEGGRNQDLPEGKRFSDNYYSQAYARLHRLGIAQTVTTCFGNPGSGRFIHYRDLRSITVREAARFQSFPDWFVFDGHLSSQMRHVGNAVPPLLAKAIAVQIGQDLHNALVNRQEGRPKRERAETVEERSRVMRAVPARNTSAELALRQALWAAGLRGYRLHCSQVPGSPDVVFTRARVAVFVDGCFWHGCGRCYREPKSNKKYWTMKVQRNRDRDARVNVLCKEAGWKVIRIWEHEVRKEPVRAARKVAKALARVLS